MLFLLAALPVSLLVAGCGRSGYECRLAGWSADGFVSDFAARCMEPHGKPLTRGEAVEIARDVAALLVDERFHDGALAGKPRCEAVEGGRGGWDVTLALEPRLGGRVAVRVFPEGWIDRIRVEELPPAEERGRTYFLSHELSANRATAERLEGGERTAAALTGMDFCRILGWSVDRLFLHWIKQDGNGDWEMMIGLAHDPACPPWVMTVRLRAGSLALVDCKAGRW